MKQNDNRLKQQGRYALVTGASAGIGAEFCRQLAALGYNLVLVARREDRLNSLAGKLQAQYGVGTLVHALDLSQRGASTDLVSRLKAEDIHIEFLVNNAGYGVPGHFTDPQWSDHEAFLQVMVTAVCELTWQLLPDMQSRKSGYVINVASLAALVPGSGGHTLYGASKAFLTRFSESLSVENSNTGVHVSALCPGFTYSEFHDVTGTRKIVSKMPSWMWMNADEVVTFGIESVMRTRPLVIAVPGRVNRMIARVIRWLPPALALRLAGRQSGRFRAQKNAQ